MYFVLSKAIGWFTVPSNVLGLVVVVGVALSMVRPVRWTRALAALGLAALVLAGASPLGAWLIRPLEDRFPVWHDDGREVTGIVVLGGTVNARISLARDQLTFGRGSALWRRPTWRGAIRGPDRVQRRQRRRARGPAEAHAVHRFASTLGLDVSRMSFDDASRNTVENASFVAALVGSPSRADGCWSRRPFICRERKLCFARPGSISMPIRSRFGRLARAAITAGPGPGPGCPASRWWTSRPRSGSDCLPPGSSDTRMCCFQPRAQLNQPPSPAACRQARDRVVKSADGDMLSRSARADRRSSGVCARQRPE